MGLIQVVTALNDMALSLRPELRPRGSLPKDLALGVDQAVDLFE